MDIQKYIVINHGFLDVPEILPILEVNEDFGEV